MELEAIDEPNSNLRGNYYAQPGYLRTDVRTGVTRNRAGTRLIALTNDFLMGLRTALVAECGSAADVVLKSCGRSWGRQFARRFEQETSDHYGRPMREFPLAMFEACLIEAFSRHGWGRLVIDWSRAERGILAVDLHGAIMAELVQEAEHPVDSLMAGILAGLFSHFSEQDLDCLQTACAACGAPVSRFVLSVAPRLAAVEPRVAQRVDHDELLVALEATRG